MAWAQVLGAVAGGVGNYFTAKQAFDDQSRYGKHMASLQQHLADTAHQRQMADLRRAGLNPILSGRLGGAGNISPPGVSMPDYGKSVSTAVQAAQASQGIAQSKATTADLEESAKLKQFQQNTEQVRTNAEAMRAAHFHAQATESMERSHLLRIQQLAQQLQIPEREAEAMYWSNVSAAGKGVSSALGLVKGMKGIKDLWKGGPLRQLRGRR